MFSQKSGKIRAGLVDSSYPEPASVNPSDLTATWQYGHLALTLPVFLHNEFWRVAYVDTSGNRRWIKPNELVDLLSELGSCENKLDRAYRWPDTPEPEPQS